MSHPDVLPARRLFLFAVLAGLLTGFVEVLLLGVQKFIFGNAIFLGPHVIWMAPLADAIWLAGLGSLWLVLSQRWRWLRSVWMVATLFAFCALLSWLFLFPRIQWYAAVLLAVGVAAQMGRMVASRLVLVFLGKPLQSLAAALLLAFCGVNGWQWWQEHRAIAQLPEAQRNAPNVVLLTLDTVRAQSLSLYGYQRRTTPNLERIAECGVKFERAYSTAPWTLPSHASMFTGYYPHELSADFLKPLNSEKRTLAEVLQQHGYLTAGFVANTYYCGYEHGLARGFVHYEDYNVTWEELLLSASLPRALLHNDTLRRWLGANEVVARKSAADINQQFLLWLGQRHSSRPFFAFLNYFDAHEPYLPPAPYNVAFTSEPCRTNWPYVHTPRTAWIEKREQLKLADEQAAQAAYESSIRYLDQQLGYLYDELARQKLLDNTLIIIASDHGEAFGEHGHHGHSDNLYPPLLQVPLLLLLPSRVPAGHSIAQPVSLRDLPATVMELLRLSPRFPGDSWTKTWELPQRNGLPLLAEVNLAPLQPERYKTATKAKLKTVIDGDFQYIKNPDGSEEVYDLHLDMRVLTGADKDNRIVEIKRRLPLSELDSLLSD